MKDLTTNAIGSSPASSLGSPATAASFISGCVNSTDSNSAGATYSKINIKVKLNGKQTV